MDDGLIGASDIAAALAATPCDVAARISRLVGLLEAAGCDALVVTNLRNIRYLTGFSGSAAQLVVHANGATLCTDGRYESQAPVELTTQSPAQYWQVISEHVSPVVAALRQVDDATRERIGEHAIEQVRAFENNGKVRVPGMARCIVGTR